MSRFKKLSHTIFECKYHVVFCPKYRFRIFRGDICEYTRQQIYSLCGQKDLVEVLELNIQEDHIHVVLSIPRKFSVSSFMGFFEGQIISSTFFPVLRSWANVTGVATYGVEVTVSAPSV